MAWAALRSGLYMVTVSRHATADDVAYVIADSGAKAVVTSTTLVETAERCLAHTPNCRLRLLVGDDLPGWTSLASARDSAERIAIADECKGDHMPYSSGTTGKPKGIKRPLEPGHPSEGFSHFAPAQALYGMDEQTVYLSPAPLYHTAPIQFCLRVQAAGGQVAYGASTRSRL